MLTTSMPHSVTNHNHRQHKMGSVCQPMTLIPLRCAHTHRVEELRQTTEEREKGSIKGSGVREVHK